jgi:hypothetical protein
MKFAFQKDKLLEPRHSMFIHVIVAHMRIYFICHPFAPFYSIVSTQTRLFELQRTSLTLL